MSTPIQIHNFDVYHHDDVPRGLHYLKNLPKKQIEEMFEDARTSADRDTHFQAHIDGKDMRYVLIHNNDGTYTLKPKP